MPFLWKDLNDHLMHKKTDATWQTFDKYFEIDIND